MSSLNRPKVGVAVIIWHDGKVIICKRHGSHGDGVWQLPGGHLEFGESWEDCAKREAKEEVGVEITNVRFVAITNDIFENDGKHYITIWMESDWAAGEPASQEPDKISHAGWCSPHGLPSPLFEPSFTNIQKIKPGLFTHKP